LDSDKLAQGIHRELVELRARANSATSVELSVLAANSPQNVSLLRLP
jgi:hypothetical protein